MPAMDKTGPTGTGPVGAGKGPCKQGDASSSRDRAAVRVAVAKEAAEADEAKEAAVAAKTAAGLAGTSQANK